RPGGAGRRARPDAPGDARRVDAGRGPPGARRPDQRPRAPVVHPGHAPGRHLRRVDRPHAAQPGRRDAGPAAPAGPGGGPEGAGEDALPLDLLHLPVAVHGDSRPRRAADHEERPGLTNSLKRASKRAENLVVSEKGKPAARRGPQSHGTLAGRPGYRTKGTHPDGPVHPEDLARVEVRLRRARRQHGRIRPPPRPHRRRRHRGREGPRRERLRQVLVGQQSEQLTMHLSILQTWLESRFASDERGASMVEYGLLLALIAVVAIVAVKTLGGSVSDKFSSVNSAIN